MVLQLYNTASRKKEDFTPQEGRNVKLYTCGPTVYSRQHIGNLRYFLWTDLLKRVLKMNSYQVNHVMNITDVGHLTSDEDEGEDKMEKAAREQKKTVWDVSKEWTAIWKEDLKKLHVELANHLTKATDHITEQIDLVTSLEAKGFTYTTNDGVYFDTSKLADYGKLARLHTEGLQEGKRIASGEKKSKTDFALWKFSPSGEKRQMEWESPWGTGFPGWHLECSAMAMKYLGSTLDIHCGGMEHIPVHHSNEIAQSECATGKPFSKYWVHGEWLVLEKEKMAKSQGNVIDLDVVEEKGFQPMDFRYYTLGTHYRKQLMFSWEGLETAKQSFERLKNKLIELQGQVVKSQPNLALGKRYIESFMNAVNDDLNTPKALAVLWDALGEKDLSAGEKLALANTFDSVLGLGLSEVQEEKFDVPAHVQALVNEREAARKAQDWKKSDELRNKIKEKGFLVKDTKEGSKISKA